VQLVAHLVDNKLIAPGATFSFNGTTGERTAAKGFLEAPVIVNGELQTGLGGGVCQVSTTVFNAAFEAGLPITERTNHALYISHYPLGRDATVDYPSVDLKFVNDTGHWLLLRTFVGPSSLVVTLYGTPQHRRVVSIAQPLRVVAPAPVKRTVDETLKPGEVVVDDPGMPAQSTSVERKAALRPDVVLELPRAAEAHPRGAEEEASADAIASCNHDGTLVGRNVDESTVACDVHPSAMSAPSRSTAYS
jgi:vancomycin resistance protein YoaR